MKAIVEVTPSPPMLPEVLSEEVKVSNTKKKRKKKGKKGTIAEEWPLYLLLLKTNLLQWTTIQPGGEL
jgi:hypothetical protein